MVYRYMSCFNARKLEVCTRLGFQLVVNMHCFKLMLSSHYKYTLISNFGSVSHFLSEKLTINIASLLRLLCKFCM
jgi:hypothetical protein